MKKAKFGFNDVKIGDKIITTGGEEGIIVAIKSYEYLNDKLFRKSLKNVIEMTELAPFKMDGSIHKDVWYSALTLAVNTSTNLIPTYYLLGIDFVEVKEIIGTEHVSFIDKIKKLFK